MEFGYWQLLIAIINKHQTQSIEMVLRKHTNEIILINEVNFATVPSHSIIKFKIKSGKLSIKSFIN